MSTIADLEALVREHAAVTAQLEPLQKRSSELKILIDETKLALRRDGLITQSPTSAEPHVDPEVETDPEVDDEVDDEEEDEPPLPPVEADQIIKLMRTYSGLEWPQGEFVDFLDVDPDSIGPVLQQLVDSGTLEKKGSKFVLTEDE